MNENVTSQLDAELEQAGEGPQMSPQMLLLEQLRITPEKELPRMDFPFRFSSLTVVPHSPQDISLRRQRYKFVLNSTNILPCKMITRTDPVIYKYLGRKHAISETFRNFVAVNKQNWKVYDYDCNKKDNA